LGFVFLICSSFDGTCHGTIPQTGAGSQPRLTYRRDSIKARPVHVTVDTVFNMEPETPVALAIWLSKRLGERGLSRSKIARRLGIKSQTYQRIESPSKTNPTLKTIVKLEQVFGNKIVQV